MRLDRYFWIALLAVVGWMVAGMGVLYGIAEVMFLLFNTEHILIFFECLTVLGVIVVASVFAAEWRAERAGG